jgi:hypothetical protein
VPDVNSVVQAVVAIAAPIGALIRIGGRRRRLRHEIRENLDLLGEIQKNEVLSQQSPAAGWLHGRITLDVARLAGVRLGPDKTPIPWGSVIFASLLAIAFGVWTFYLDRHGFVWYSVFPGVIAAMLVISVLGMTTDREKPPEEASDASSGEAGSDDAAMTPAEPDVQADLEAPASDPRLAVEADG